jgi:D-lactate dehydrogenase
MKTAIFSGHKFEKSFYINNDSVDHEFRWIEAPLSLATVMLAQGSEAVCIFVNDDASAPVLEKLQEIGIRFLVLRSAGFNQVDLGRARQLNIRVARVPEYSPYAVAEYAVALMMTLNRKIVKAHNRVREGNFSLDGLTGFDMHGRTVGIIGLGKIGRIVANIVQGFGCRILAYDPFPDKNKKESFEINYTVLDTLCRESDIITLHAPLTEETKYLIHKARIELMKNGVMLINTGRGGLIHTKDVIAGLKSGKIGYLGMDVYEEEAGLFFEDHSSEILQDDVIARLMSFQNVIVTSHQAFLTHTALKNIAEVTMQNLDDFEKSSFCHNELGI